MQGSVIIEPDGDGFAVVLEPPLPSNPQRQWFADAREARGVAGGLRLVHGLKKIDRTGEKCSPI